MCARELSPPQKKRRKSHADYRNAPLPVIAFTGDGKPLWDEARRELRLDGVLVKRFRQPAKNQEAILAAFQDDGWPARIDDPLAGVDNQDAQDRLHDTVKKLNRQPVPLIRFLSDGRGGGVLWELR